METIISSVIVGILSLVGVIITNNASSKKIDITLEKNQAVMETKLENLTQEVKKHNEFATRIPLLEQRITHIEKNYNKS